MNVRYNSTEEYDDAVYHFFQDAWHLKNWVKHDPSVPRSVSQRIENDLAASQAFLAAADVSNGSKHFEFDSGHTARIGAKIIEREVAIGGTERVRHTHRVSFAGQVVTAVELADKIVDEWDVLLKGYGLQ